MKIKDFLNEDIEIIKQWISKNYNEMKVAELLDDEILNWIDVDWEEEGFDDEYEWYIEYGHGEAEDEIVNQIIMYAKKATKTKLSGNEELKLDNWIRDKYNLLS